VSADKGGALNVSNQTLQKSPISLTLVETQGEKQVNQITSKKS